jgi:FkbM family methyltransferase
MPDTAAIHKFALIRSGRLGALRRTLKPMVMRWPWPVSVRTDCGLRCYVDLRTALGFGLMVTGSFDPPLARFLRTALRPGGVMVDVGANVGYMSLVALSAVGATGSVYSFEMDRRSFRCLSRTQAMHRTYHWKVFHQAVGERDGMVGLEQTKEPAHAHVKVSGTLTIPMKRLDDCGTERVDLIKVDVEGYELQVLQGAAQLLGRDKPVVVCELNDELLRRFGTTSAQVFAFMGSMGYEKSALEGAHDPTYVFRYAQ